MAAYFNWWGTDFFYKPLYLDSMGAGKNHQLQLYNQSLIIS